jgi:hypothetical protein
VAINRDIGVGQCVPVEKPVGCSRMMTSHRNRSDPRILPQGTHAGGVAYPGRGDPPRRRKMTSKIRMRLRIAESGHVSI